ncbi:hypothetical protein ACLOJK_000272 [Asimina triloba]
MIGGFGKGWSRSGMGRDRPRLLIRWATDSGGHDLLPLTRLRRMAVTCCPDGLKETCYDLDFCLDAVDSLQPVWSDLAWAVCWISDPELGCLRPPDLLGFAGAVDFEMQPTGGAITPLMEIAAIAVHALPWMIARLLVWMPPI